jgi:hypothetical protein
MPRPRLPAPARRMPRSAPAQRHDAAAGKWVSAERATPASLPRCAAPRNPRGWKNAAANPPSSSRFTRRRSNAPRPARSAATPPRPLTCRQLRSARPARADANPAARQNAHLGHVARQPHRPAQVRGAPGRWCSRGRTQAGRAEPLPAPPTPAGPSGWHTPSARSGPAARGTSRCAAGRPASPTERCASAAARSGTLGAASGA